MKWNSIENQIKHRHKYFVSFEYTPLLPISHSTFDKFPSDKNEQWKALKDVFVYHIYVSLLIVEKMQQYITVDCISCVHDTSHALLNFVWMLIIPNKKKSRFWKCSCSGNVSLVGMIISGRSENVLCSEL